MEDITSWQAISVTAGGWSLFASLAWMVLKGLTRGDILTRREADAMQKTIDSQRKENTDLREQNGLLLRSAVPAVNSTFSALRAQASSEFSEGSG